MAISKIKSKSIIDDLELQGGATQLSSEEETAPENGQIRFNETFQKQEIYSNGRWDVINPQSIQVAMSVALGGA